jgi:hypothetical protein
MLLKEKCRWPLLFQCREKEGNHYQEVGVDQPLDKIRSREKGTRGGAEGGYVQGKG